MEQLATFFGEHGNRCAEIAILATAITSPIFVVDFFKVGELERLTKFFETQPAAEEAAMLYAFEGVLNE